MHFSTEIINKCYSIINIINIIIYVQNACSQLYSPAYPIIWRKSKHHVATEYIQAQLDIHLKSPCHMINSSMIDIPNTKITPSEMFHAQEKCEEFYQRHIIKTFQKFCTPIKTEKRVKKAVVAFASGVIFTIITIIATIGFFAYIKSQLGVNDYSMNDAQLKEMNSQIHRKMVEEMTKLHQDIERMKLSLKSFQYETRMFIRFEKYQSIIEDIFSVIEDEPIPKIFNQLFHNISICPDCPFEHWHLEECQIKVNKPLIDSQLRLNINAIKIDRNYDVIRADPFNIISEDENNSSNLCFTEYTGPSYAVINKNTKCIRNIMFHPIDDHQSPFVFHSVKCNNQQFKNKVLWRPFECQPRGFISSEEAVQIKSDKNYVYFYCYLQNVTIHGVNYPCKNQVYKMKRGQKLTINNQSVMFTKMKINLHHNLQEEINEIINIKAFDTFNSTVNLQELSSLVKQEGELVNRVMLSATKTFYLHTLILITIFFIFTTLLLYYYQRIRTRRFRRMIRNQYRLSSIKMNQLK